MEYRGTSFEDYTLNEFIRVQLLFDESFKYVKISDPGDVPLSPPQLEVKSKSLFSRTGFMKYLSECIENISEFQLFQLDPLFTKNLIRFHAKNKSNFKSFKVHSLLDSFQTYLRINCGVSSTNTLYYKQSIQLLDLMLCTRGSGSDRTEILNTRDQLLSCKILQLPIISDQKLKIAVAASFNVSLKVIDDKIEQLKLGIRKSQVVEYISTSPNVLSKKYKITDFDDPKHSEEWKSKTEALEKYLIDRFTDDDGSRSTSTSSIVPNQLDDVVRLLIEISVTSKPAFFEGLAKCMQLWQVNPFFINLAYIHSSFTCDGPVNPDNVQKALNLAELIMPVTLKFNTWPHEEKRIFLRLSMQLYKETKETITPYFKCFFSNQEAFTAVLKFLHVLRLNLKNVKQEVNLKLEEVINERLEHHKKKTHLEENCRLDNFVSYLTLVSRDINLLANWKTYNQELNLTFQIFETGSKIIMIHTLDKLKGYISEIKKNNFSLVNDQKNSKEFGTFIDLVNNLKDRTKFKYDFQNEIYKDFFTLVQSWDIEMINKTKLIIANDINMNRLDGCSYSAGVQNLILLLESYVKLLDSFKWRNELQLSELSVTLYKNIINAIKYYHRMMMKRINEINPSLNTSNVDVFICLNNIYKLSTFLDLLQKKENILKISKYLIDSKINKANKRIKYVSVNIKNAENIEDSKGNPMSLKIILSGLVNSATRTIVKDFNPDWFEEFNVIVDSNNKTEVLKIDLVDADVDKLYRSLEYPVFLSKETLVKQHTDKIPLKPRSGSLNISVQVEFEKNDPLFYILNCKKEIDNSLKRSINLIIESYMISFKEIFTTSYLKENLIENPVRSENNFTALQDPNIDSLVSEFKIKNIPVLYNNVHTELFDKLIVDLWVKIMKIAENLILPRISVIYYKIEQSPKSSSQSWSFIHQTTREEFIRVVEWVYKFHKIFDLPEMILSNPIEAKFREFNNIKNLFNIPDKLLHQKYNKNWQYMNRNMIKRLSGIRYEKSEWERNQDEKELILRILLTRQNGLKYVKKVLQIEARFERALKTEVEIAYLQQFL